MKYDSENRPIDAEARYFDKENPSPTPSSMGDEGEFQKRVDVWLLECFGEAIARDKVERNHRFLEESLELVQSLGCTKSEAHQLVDYVFSRDLGEPHQEVGGVTVTLAALCIANNLSMSECGEKELTRIWTKVEKIRAKQAAKPKHSPLPSSTLPSIEGEKWISVEEKIPDSGVKVLCLTKDIFKRMIENSWEAHTNQDEDWFRRNFSHWRQLPEPPNQNPLAKQEGEKEVEVAWTTDGVKYPKDGLMNDWDEKSLENKKDKQL